MSAATFTPGPWHSLDIGEIVPSDADGYPCDDLRICFMATAGNDPAAPDRIEANARLIAASPDMYDAIERARVLIGARNDTLTDAQRQSNINEAWHILNAAAAKARGEQS